MKTVAGHVGSFSRSFLLFSHFSSPKKNPKYAAVQAKTKTGASSTTVEYKPDLSKEVSSLVQSPLCSESLKF